MEDAVPTLRSVCRLSNLFVTHSTAPPVSACSVQFGSVCRMEVTKPSKTSTNVIVAVRVRPMNSREKSKGSFQTWKALGDKACITQLTDDGKPMPGHSSVFTFGKIRANYLHTPLHSHFVGLELNTAPGILFS